MNMIKRPRWGFWSLTLAVSLFAMLPLQAQESITAVTEAVAVTTDDGTLTEAVTIAVEEAAPSGEPSLEARVADIEAYFHNVDRPSGDASKIKVPGPGHNAWQMMSTALVLFMTLPGLALFYGGLVRSKNVLSILAMCLGITGLVSFLWWLCGYSSPQDRTLYHFAASGVD